MGSSTGPSDASGAPVAEVDQVVEVTQLVGALIAESLASLDPPLTMPQWRTLVLARGDGCNVSAVAEDLGIHMSNATRLCDRLVTAGLLERRRSADDKRQVVHTHSAAGAALYEAAMDFRRRRIERVMARMPTDERAALVASARAFLRAADAALTTPGGQSGRW